MEIDPKDALAIEDSVAGVKAAKSAGMKCLGLADNAREKMLRQAGVDNIIPNFVGLTLERLELLIPTRM